MAANNIQIMMTAADGKPIAELQRLIAERVRLIKGETTESAVTATAINILKSVRSATKRADPKNAKFGFTLTERNDLVAGFKGVRGRRVIRERGGHELMGVKTINLAGKYQKNEAVKVYIGIVRHGKIDKSNLNVSKDAFERFYIISRSKDIASNYLEQRLKSRIETFSGMAKWVVGQAMKDISAKMNVSTSSAQESVRSIAKRIGMENLKISCHKDGYDSGEANVYMLDSLDYAMTAIKGGSATFNAIAMKAANKTASIINHYLNHMGKAWEGGVYQAPFPEVRAKR